MTSPVVTPPTDPPRPDDLDQLTRRRARASLRDLVGDETAEAIWRSACAAVDVPPDRPLELDQLSRVADELSSREGAVSLVGNSLAIRIRTYQMLSSAQRLETFLGSTL